jgi:hypothetical protein
MLIKRRQFMSSTLRAVGASVALPILDCMLTDSGTAFASSGERIPVRFGTWVWGCGHIPELWIPQTEGPLTTLPSHIQSLEPYKKDLAILSGFDVKLDGVPNKPHITGCLGLRTGVPVPNEEVKAPTLDVLIADIIGQQTRFKSIEVSTSGVQKSYSYRAAAAPNPSEISPIDLYQRIFGTGFQDPNQQHFSPDPSLMIRRSVLSEVGEQRRKIMKTVGANDRARLDEYFTGLRQLEQQLLIQLQPPARVENFVLPNEPQNIVLDSEMGTVLHNHKIMAGLIARALQCNQTSVFNVLLSDTTSNLRRPGQTTTHHTLTHEEPVDKVLGYQKDVAWFAEQSMYAWRDMLDALAEIPEGDGRLLDNCLVLAHSDCSIAKSHAVEGIPMMIAGSAGGRVRTGFHLKGNADAVTRVGLTLQQLMGVETEYWGVMSMRTNKPITELII